jgi:hypothetical protein
MIELRFGARALTEVRFAISPLIELMRSVRTLHDPAGQALQLPWVVEARKALAGFDPGPLWELQAPNRYTPDFVHPPPHTPLVELEDQLAEMVATPPEQIRAEVQRTYRGLAPPEMLMPFVDDPASAVRDLADLMREYWERTLASHWPRIRMLLEGDVLYRARQMADGGALRLFADVDPTVTWADGVLRIEKGVQQTVDLEERGLLFVPSVFVWPRVGLITDPAWQPALIYPARGIGTLWEPVRPAVPAALAALLGRNRAAILNDLDSPRSTTELAVRLGVTAGGISQHLTILRDAGLVIGHRVGRNVLYLRSQAGDALVAPPPVASA